MSVLDSKLFLEVIPNNGIETNGFYVSAAVLYQLSYEHPYIGSRPICLILLNPWKEWNEEWRWCELRKYNFKWRYDRRSGTSSNNPWREETYEMLFWP